ncbi:hypothetical protein V6N11_001464 [Hibiscus sabdariffa]|uniref:Reverse transcriptase Ty1/copia-type domain-containing protein n=1 Tax=Hibiscus sabdariffa TaxID=183260 RepID=A0ABR2RZR9_9ROSI
MDVKTAFLNGKLEEDVYMTQPKGFVTPGNAGKSTYIDKMLKRFNMEASKKGFLPMTHGISLSKEMCPSTPQERERMSQISYASAIGSIMYAMICTRIDLSYALKLGVVPSISDAVELYCDNNGAIAQAKEPKSHLISKHILRRFHLIREIIDRGDVEICKVHTDDNIADPLTKPLAQQKHDRHTKSLGIRYVSD